MAEGSLGGPPPAAQPTTAGAVRGGHQRAVQRAGDAAPYGASPEEWSTREE
jgi:hypothetical protein